MSLMVEDMAAIKDVVYSGRKVRLDKLNNVDKSQEYSCS